MAVDIRSVTAEEMGAFRRAVMETFGAEELLEEGNDRLASILARERTYAAFDGAEVVGTSGAYDLALTVPGAELAMAGLTVVTVRPTHRRQGILRAMMRRHFEDVAERGETLSGLWASEAAIYPRYGYGVAADGYHLEVDASRLEFLPGPELDTVRFLESDGAERLLQPIYERGRRPGCYRRTPAWWRNRWLYDGPDKRQGASPMRIAVASRGDAHVGYVTYRQRPKFDRGTFNGRVEIIEMIAEDATAERSLWHFVSHIDLFPHVVYWNAPVDTLLPWLVADRRAVRRSRGDTLWLCLRDVAGALEGRGYEREGALSFEVRDADGAAQCYRLEVGGGRASCAKGGGRPEAWLARPALASLYLGGFSPGPLAASGRAGGSLSALRLLGELLASERPPWCPEVF